MSENKPFEKLWEDAESISDMSEEARSQLYISLQESITDYKKLDKLPSPEIQDALKTKKLGEIIFQIAELSKIDNINAYKALAIENEFRRK